MENISLSSYSFFTPVGGYGICNIGWAKHLTRLGVNVYCAPDFSPQQGSNEWTMLNDEEKELFKKPFKQEKIGISGTTPFEFHRNNSEIKIAMTMAESSRLGKQWVDSCNSMTHIIVPNEFFERVFRESGVTQPITIIPSGIDLENYPYYERPERDVFTFGICGYLNERKGAKELIRAFASEFNNSEPVKLKLHTSNAFFRYYSQFKDPRIELTYQYKTFSQLNEFYKSLDCFVFPSKAEGIGYPPREAMATGLPVIVTNYSGLEEVANAEFAYPITVKDRSARIDMLEQPGDWAEIDIAELMYLMRYVYENQKEARKKGKKASEKIKEMYFWPNCAKKFVDFLKQYDRSN